jgi:hypothetical protein
MLTSIERPWFALVLFWYAEYHPVSPILPHSPDLGWSGFGYDLFVLSQQHSQSPLSKPHIYFLAFIVNDSLTESKSNRMVYRHLYDSSCIN